MLRVDVSAAVKAGPHFTLLGEVRSENLGQVQPVRALRAHPALDIARVRHPGRARSADLRRVRAAHLRERQPAHRLPARLPIHDDDARRRACRERRRAAAETQHGLAVSLLGRRAGGGGRGVARQRLSLGHGRSGAWRQRGSLSATASVTAGTVSNPLFRDDNSGRQVAGRVELRPVSGLIAGASLARGPFLGRAAARAASGNVADGHDKEFTQTAWGGDLEYSRDHYLLRFEMVGSAWRLPAVGAPALPQPLGALSTSIEGRYKLRPGLYAAARFDHLGFSEVVGTRRHAAVGRAGDARRSRRGLLAAAQPAAEALVSAQPPRRRPAGPSRGICPPPSSSSGSR